MADDLSKLTTAVAANTVAINAAIAAGIGQKSQQAAIDALTTQVETNNTNLTAATPPAV